MKQKKFLYTVSLICIIFLACSDQGYQVPYVVEPFWIYNIESDPSATDLLTTNGYIYVTGGYNNNGIIIYRQKMAGDIDDFIAFDRTCPYEVKRCQVKMLRESIYDCECECCGSIFNLIAGTVNQGPSEHFLTQLRCEFIDGSIHVY